ELRPGEPASIDVGAVGEQREDAVGAELREPVHVEMLAVDWRLIDLEVAGMDHNARWRMNRERDTVGHAVRDADELDLKRPDRDPIARSNGSERLGFVDAVLL